MNKKAVIKTLGMTKWFIKNSWTFIVSKPVDIIKFFKGFIPAGMKFARITYKSFLEELS